MSDPVLRSRTWHRRLLRWAQHEMPRPRLRLRRERRRARRGERRRILLVGEDALMWQYLDDYRFLFGGDARLAFFAAPAHKGSKAEPCRKLAAERGLPFLSRRESIRTWFDLVVFADHGAAHRYAPAVPKLRIQHALSAGKRIYGQQYRYGPRFVLRGRGRPVYDMLFEASVERKERVQAEMPSLRGRIRVVGDLRADALLALREQRERIRADLGYDAGDRVVVLCSTWGAGSLVEQMGRALVEEAEALARRSRSRFLVSVHPRGWREPSVAAWLRSIGSDGVRVLEPGGGWERAFVAADALVGDHTSLLAMFALLGKPIVCVPVSSQLLEPDSHLGRIQALAPTLGAPGELSDALGGAAEGERVDALQALARAIDAYPGAASGRMRSATYELLSLPAPRRAEGSGQRVG